MTKVLDCGLEVKDFEISSRNYVYFQINNLGKSMNLFIPSAMVDLFGFYGISTFVGYIMKNPFL